jgi:CYTH domain-containing protein
VGVEIERKFRVPDPPRWLSECRSEAIDQGYVAIAEGGEEVRVRRVEGSSGVLTVKRGQGEERLEVEIELSDDQFRALWPLTEGRRLEKRRHLVEGEPTIEVDVYGGELEGLVIAESEFPSVEASHRFDPPDWLGEELTGDAGYANQQLALRGLPTG